MTRDSSPCGRGEPTPGWATVSTKELAASSKLVSDLLNPMRNSAVSDPTALARALVIQHLFAREAP